MKLPNVGVVGWCYRIVAVGLVALAACSSDGGSDPDVRTAGIYESALRWVMESRSPPPAADGDLPVIFVVSADGSSIATEAQVAVVNALHDEATLRFTDAKDDALDADVEGRPVKDDGVLVIVGELADESPLDVELDVYRNEADDRSYVLTMSGGGAVWRVTAASEDG